MSLINKTVTFKLNGELVEGIVIEKYKEAHSWDTGNGMAYGTCDHYIVKVNGNIHHIYARDVIDVKES